MPSFRNQYDYQPDNTSNMVRSTSSNNINRNSLKNTNQRPQSYNDIIAYGESFKPTNAPVRRNSLAKLNDFRKKVGQVIELCHNQNADVKGEFNQVITQERKVYDLLMENPSVLRRTVSQQSIPQAGFNMQQTVPYNQSYGQNPTILGQSQRPQQIKTPFRPQKAQNIPQSQYYIPNMSQVGARQNNYPPNISHSNVMRPQPLYYPLQNDMQNAPFGTFGGDYPSQNLQNSFHKLKTAKQIHLNDDALRLIEQIQRKAFEQIQRLRKQKLQLMQRLNQQIRNLNEQRRKNVELQNILVRYTNQPQSFGVGAGQSSPQLQAQINRLESELQRTNEVNHNLRLQLANRGSGVPGIEELLRQGEAIRQQTVRLLKIKEQGEGNNRVQQLQRKLAVEQAEKQAALNQIRVLKDKIGGVSQAKTLEPSQSYDKSVSRNRSTLQGKSVGQYEDLVSQMKRITGF